MQSASSDEILNLQQEALTLLHQNPREARALISQAVELAAQTRAKDDLTLAKIRLTQARIQCILGEMSESLASLEIGLNLFRKHDYKSGIAADSTATETFIHISVNLLPHYLTTTIASQFDAK